MHISFRSSTITHHHYDVNQHKRHVKAGAETIPTTNNHKEITTTRNETSSTCTSIDCSNNQQQYSI
jgi:hypothetical protein